MGPNKPAIQSAIPLDWKVAHSTLTDFLRQIAQNVTYLRDGFLFQIRTITAADTMRLTDSIVLANGTFSFTLLPAQQWKERRMTVKNIGTGTITVDASGAETIDNSATYVIATRYDSICFVSDGTAVWII